MGHGCVFISALAAHLQSRQAGVILPSVVALGVGFSMSGHQAALTLFAVAFSIVIAIAFVTTLDRVQTHRVSNDAPPGTTGLAKPHPRLDRAPGEPILQDR